MNATASARPTQVITGAKQRKADIVSQVEGCGDYLFSAQTPEQIRDLLTEAKKHLSVSLHPDVEMAIIGLETAIEDSAQLIVLSGVQLQD